MANYQPVRIAYDVSEPAIDSDEDLAPLIFLHGVTSCKEHWGDIPQIVSTVTKRKAYAIDARNHGDSEWTDYYNFDVNADDLIHFMDTMSIHKAILIGQSMGGITAIKTALKRPDRIEGIVVEDMHVRKIHKQILDSVLVYITAVRKAMEVLPSELDEEGAKKFIVRYLHSNLPPEFLKQEMLKRERVQEEDTRFIRLYRDATGRFSFRANMEVIERAMKDPEALSSEAEGVFQGPACFIYGRLSPFLVGADQHHIKQFFPNAVFEGIEDAAHDVHTDRPLEFTDALLQFLSQRTS